MPSTVITLSVPAVLIALGAASYATIITTYFLSDDFSLIARGASRGYFFVMAGGLGGFLRPGVILSFVIDRWLWAFNPIGYHLTNIAWHVVAAYGVYRVGRYVFRHHDNPVMLSALAACLFVVLPSHSESVSWIAGRSDVIATALGLGATWCLVVVLERRSHLALIVGLVLLAGTLLTKEVAVVFPAVWCAIVAHYRWTERSIQWQPALMVLASVVLLVAYFALRRSLLGQFIGGYGTDMHVSLVNLSTLANLCRYLVRTFSPPLPMLDPAVESTIAVLACVIGVSVVTLAIVRRGLSSAGPTLLLLGTGYLLSLLPALSMKVELVDTRNERFLYLPSAFACVLLVALVHALTRRTLVTAVTMAVLIGLEAMSLQWVNTRWIAASRISRAFASEVARFDPTTTVLLNIPNNFQGAYIFHTGLQQAATTFQGHPSGPIYRSLSAHDVQSIHDRYEATIEPSGVSLVVPAGVDFYNIRPEHKVQRTKMGLRVSLPVGGDQLVLFTIVDGRAMLNPVVAAQ